MARAVICKGDPTSHGGIVLEGNENATCLGRPIALRGHMVSCPQCKGTFPIIDGLGHHSFGGIGTVVEGMRASCGATMIATQQAMTVDDAGGSDSAGNSESDEQATAQQGDYSGRFRAVDEHTGEPVAGLPYRIDLPDGTFIRGVTDADGYTQQVTSHHPDTVQLHWEPEELR